jgi:hypothetical protein
MLKTARNLLIMSVLAALLGVSAAFAGRHYDESWTFSGKDRIKLSTVSGDCIIESVEGDQIIVELEYSYRPSDSFEPLVRERGRTIQIEERMYDSNSGYSRWTLRVPNDVRVEFETASGDLTATDLRGDIQANTASGDFEIEHCEGEMDLNTASGDVRLSDSRGEFDANTASGDVEVSACDGEIDVSTASGDIDLRDCKGEFDVSVASGDIDARGMLLEYESSFSSASGDAHVEVAATPEYDLSVSSASGDAILSYGGHPFRGRFEFTAQVRRGRIDSPIEFEDEEIIERHGDRDYVRKWFTEESDSPLIAISTGSGRASLRTR